MYDPLCKQKMQWSFFAACLILVLAPCCAFYAYTDWDDPFEFKCPIDQPFLDLIYGAYHPISKERRFFFQCKKMSPPITTAVECKNTRYTSGEVNHNWRLACRGNAFVSGMFAKKIYRTVAVNKTVEHVGLLTYSFFCCKIRTMPPQVCECKYFYANVSSNVTLVETSKGCPCNGSYWSRVRDCIHTPWMKDRNGSVYYRPPAGLVIQAMMSYLDPNLGFRVFKFTYCKIILPGSSPIPPSATTQQSPKAGNVKLQKDPYVLPDGTRFEPNSFFDTVGANLLKKRSDATNARRLHRAKRYNDRVSYTYRASSKRLPVVSRSSVFVRPLGALPNNTLRVSTVNP